MLKRQNISAVLFSENFSSIEMPTGSPASMVILRKSSPAKRFILLSVNHGLSNARKPSRRDKRAEPAQMYLDSNSV